MFSKSRPGRTRGRDQKLGLGTKAENVPWPSAQVVAEFQQGGVGNATIGRLGGIAVTKSKQCVLIAAAYLLLENTAAKAVPINITVIDCQCEIEMSPSFAR